jgi:exopolysaccharide production protein ExoZ
VGIAAILGDGVAGPAYCARRLATCAALFTLPIDSPSHLVYCPPPLELGRAMRYTNLQILRIIGATIVLVYHLNFYAERELQVSTPVLKLIGENLAGPAVSLFFALSGFVLMLSLEATPVRTFAAARFLRIFPAYWLAVLIAAVMLKFVGLPFLWDRAQWAALFLLPVGLENATYRLGVEWTLVFEVLFYAALCVFAAIHARRGPTIGVTLWLAAVVGAMIVRPAGFQTHPTWSEIALSPMTMPFLFGALAVHLRRWMGQLRYVAPLLIPTLFVCSRMTERFDVSQMFVAASSALLIVWAADVSQVAADHPLVKYGDWSYGVYLVHTPIIFTLFKLSSKHGWGFPASRFILVAGMSAFALGLLYGWFESGMYKRMRRLIVGRNRKSELRVVPRAA